MTMRVVFLGSGAFGLPTLEALAESHELVGVISQPARPAGRRRVATPTPVSARAEALSCPLHCTAQANDEATICWARALRADAAVVVAFGQKLHVGLLESLGGTVVNLHASLLPKYRGAAPINWAMVRGETETGVSVISVAERMDAGAVHAQRRVKIDPDQTAGELHDRLALLGPTAVGEVLAAAASGPLSGMGQDETLVTQAPKLTKKDGAICFDADPVAVRCRVHGMTPWPAARVTWVRQDRAQRVPLTLRRVVEAGPVDAGVAPGTVLADHVVAARGGGVRLLELQLPGKRPMTVDQFVRGNPMPAGDRLEPPRADTGAGADLAE